MTTAFLEWTPRPKPSTQPMEGRFVRLEKLDPAKHTNGLFDASAQPDGEERFRWLPEVPPIDRSDFRKWVEQAAASEDPLFFAVIDKASGRIAGRQTFMRMDMANGVAEIGHIYWGPLVSRRLVVRFRTFGSHCCMSPTKCSESLEPRATINF